METSNETEVRAYANCNLCVEERDAGGPRLSGYAARFNKNSEDMGFIERIAPGAFTRTLEEGADVRALVEHDPARIIGRSTAGTLMLEETRLGLKVSIDPPDTSAGRDLITSIKRGDLSQMSFGFRAMVDEWDDAKRPPVRTLKDVDLIEVSVVAFPAYPDTSVALRSLGAVRGGVEVVEPDGNWAVRNAIERDSLDG